MITAIDTNILLDIFLPDKRFVAESAKLLKKRIITDFLIGAHAMIKAERFLTRNRGFYKSYFPELQMLSL